MKSILFPVTALLCAAFLSATAAAGDTVIVTINGEVEFGNINPLPLGSADVGEKVSLTFELDTDVFTNNPNFPTRGYHIDQASFALHTDTHVIGLQSPFPAGTTPYFVIRNNDPGVDGFFVADDLSSYTGVPYSQAGNFGQFRNEFHVTYGVNELPSLDIEDALGSYDFTGLTVFNWVIQDGPFDALGILFEDLTIELEVNPWTNLGQALGGTHGDPLLLGLGSLVGGTPVTLGMNNALESAGTFLVVGVGTVNLPLYGGTLIPEFQAPNGLFLTLATNGSGNLVVSSTWPSGLPSGLAITFQNWIVDPGGPFGFAASNGLTGTTP